METPAVAAGEKLGVVDGRPSPLSKMVVPVFDRSVRYGLGVFETVGVHAGRPFLLGQHARRLVQGLGRLGLASSLDPRTLVRWGQRAVELASVQEGVLRILATAGDDGALRPRVLAWAMEEPPTASEAFERGLRASIHPLRRGPASPLSGTKSLAYADCYLARWQANARGFDEAILCSSEGRIAEGTASNVFIVEGSRLVTPPLSEGILPGVTRAFILEVARGVSLEPMEEPIEMARLMRSSEPYLMSTQLGLALLVAVADKMIAEGSPGPVTHTLRRSYRGIGRGEYADSAATAGWRVERGMDIT